MKKVFSRKELIHNALELIRYKISQQNRMYDSIDFSTSRYSCMEYVYHLWMLGIISEDKRNLLSTIVSSEFAKIYEVKGYR